jgi:hypothetical protein
MGHQRDDAKEPGERHVATVVCLDEQARLSQPPFVRRWSNSTSPLPVRVFQKPFRQRVHPLDLAIPQWLPTGAVERPFDFCGHVSRLCADIVKRCTELRHIDVSRLLFAATQARNGRRRGLQARTTPLRCRDGQLVRRRCSTAYQVQRYFVDAQEMLYVITFCLPRFLDQPFDDKFITLFHELFHINPQFDGDLRRHQGRYAIHSHSKRGYDEYMADLARGYLADGAPPDLHAFLRLNFTQLQQRHGQVQGVVVPRPKLIPLPARR